MKRHGNVIPIDKSNEFDNNKAPRPKKHEIYGVIVLFELKWRKLAKNVTPINKKKESTNSRNKAPLEKGAPDFLVLHETYFMKWHDNVILIDKRKESENTNAPRSRKHEFNGAIVLTKHNCRQRGKDSTPIRMT